MPPSFVSKFPCRTLSSRGVLLIALLALSACERKEKRVLRTEPWPAPVALSASSAAPVTPAGEPVRYAVDSARVTIELPARKKKPVASLAKVEGDIDLDVQRPENTRAELRADLLSLTLSEKGRDAPELLAKAFDWLEISGNKAPEERDKNRSVRLEITGFDPVAVAEDARRGRPSPVVARGNLTLHHFRVPVTLELDVQLRPAVGGEPSRLSIRTRRPLVVSLVAHDILPRDPQGALLADGLRSLGTDVGREARISAEISATGAPARQHNP
ncbi:MAG: hypothetical protein ACOY0T_37255 [Myxococcota bacterium]